MLSSICMPQQLKFMGVHILSSSASACYSILLTSNSQARNQTLVTLSGLECVHCAPFLVRIRARVRVRDKVTFLIRDTVSF